MKTAKSLPNQRLRGAIGAGLLIRTLLVASAWAQRGPVAFLVPDSFSYLKLAARLASGKGFVHQWNLPEMFRTPGYPLLLSAGSAIGHPVLFALVLQSQMTAGISALTYSMARRLTGDLDNF